MWVNYECHSNNDDRTFTHRVCEMQQCGYWTWCKLLLLSSIWILQCDVRVPRSETSYYFDDITDVWGHSSLSYRCYSWWPYNTSSLHMTNRFYTRWRQSIQVMDGLRLSRWINSLYELIVSRRDFVYFEVILLSLIPANGLQKMSFKRLL